MDTEDVEQDPSIHISEEEAKEGFCVECKDQEVGKETCSVLFSILTKY
jgi:hypothetical protein